MDRDELAALAPALFRFSMRLAGNRHAAEDLAQEALVRALSARKSLQKTGAAKVWLFRIAVNCWRDRLRKRREPVELPEEIPDSTSERSDGLADREELERVLQALQRLPPRQREVLHLVAVEELTQHEVADVLEITVDAVKASLSVARQRLREEMGEATSTPKGSEEKKV